MPSGKLGFVAAVLLRRGLAVDATEAILSGTATAPAAALSKVSSFYKEKALFSPGAVNATLLQEPVVKDGPLGVAGDGYFNPGIVPLPPADLATVQNLFPTAVYLANMRQMKHECFLKKAAKVHGALKGVGGYESLFVFLDGSFKLLGRAGPANARNGFLRKAEDVRLDAIQGPDGKVSIVAGFNVGGRDRKGYVHQWRPRWVVLSWSPGRRKLYADIQPAPPAFLKWPTFLRGRSMGFVKYQNKTLIMNWISQPLSVHEAAEFKDSDGHVTPSEVPRRFILGPLGTKMHCNGSPVNVWQDGQEALLVVSHVHLDLLPIGKRPGSVTKFGNTYLSYFLLVEARPPWRVLSHSSPWCLPARGNPAMCETIQFVSTILLSPKEPNELILGVGIQDCESHIYRLRLSEVIALAKACQPNISSVGP